MPSQAQGTIYAGTYRSRQTQNMQQTYKRGVSWFKDVFDLEVTETKFLIVMVVIAMKMVINTPLIKRERSP